MKRLKLLITGGGGSGTEGLERLWRDRYDVHFADASREAIPRSVGAGRAHAIPMAGPQWSTAIVRLCRQLGIDVLVPTVDEELALVPEVTTGLPGLHALLPAPRFVALMKDKLESMRALEQAGIDAAVTRTIGDSGEIGFPCIIKPRDGRGSRGFHVLRSPQHLDAYVTLSDWSAAQLVVQEQLIGQEWTVYVSADRTGRIRGVVPMRVDLKRGVTIRAATVLHQRIMRYCESINDAFSAGGPFNVQLMETDRRIAAFEINPRVSTTLCLAVAAGADPIADFLEEPAAPGLRPFVDGVRLRRNWLNDFEGV